MNAQPNTEDKDYSSLGRIGLSKLEIKCYETLYKYPCVSCQQLAQVIGHPYRSVHRSIKRLQQKGFVRHVYTGIHPNKYDAVLINEALVQYTEWQYRTVACILNDQLVETCEMELHQLRAQQQKQN